MLCCCVTGLHILYLTSYKPKRLKRLVEFRIRPTKLVIITMGVVITGAGVYILRVPFHGSTPGLGVTVDLGFALARKG